MVESCLFCKIVSGEIDATILFEDDAVVAFRDIQPQAPVHVLLIPRRHMRSLDDLRPEDGDLVGRLILAAAQVARDQDVRDGYRLVVNNGAPAGQSVFHVHVHLLGGRRMTWPPG